MKRHFDPSQSECMDRGDNPLYLLKEDLKNLRLINRFFGGHIVTRNLFLKLMNHCRVQKTLYVVDIGTGSADLPRLMLRWNRGSKPLHIIAIDANPQILGIAQSLSRDFPEIQFIQADARHLPFRANSLNGTFCSLALHHFAAHDAIHILQEMKRITQNMTAVSDLIRSIPHLIAAWILTRIWLRNSMTQKDAILSVKRAFTVSELHQLVRQAGWKKPQQKRSPFFRQAVWSFINSS